MQKNILDDCALGLLSPLFVPLFSLDPQLVQQMLVPPAVPPVRPWPPAPPAPLPDRGKDLSRVLFGP